ncbi:hypothetical protein PSTT_13098, partial [Puccinia striiformis]
LRVNSQHKSVEGKEEERKGEGETNTNTETETERGKKTRTEGGEGERKTDAEGESGIQADKAAGFKHPIIIEYLLDRNQRLLGWPSYNRKRPFIRACRLFSRSAGDCESLNLRSQQEVTGLIAHKAIDTGSSSQSLFQAHKRREPQVETQDLTIMNTTSELLENSIPQPQRKVIALFHAFILLEEEEPNSIKIDRNRNSVIILAENIGHTTHP